MKITRFGHAVIEGDTHIGKWVEDTGKIDHGQDIEQRFREWISEGDTVIDVGANIGDHTVPYAQIVGPEGKVIAFEPNPPVFKCLKHNIHNYPWVEAYQCGLSCKSCNVEINVQPNVGASFLTEYEGMSENPIPVMRLDDFRVDECSFIKIDVEGFEIPMLDGAIDTLRRCRPIIRIEVLDGNQKRYGFSANHIFQWFHDYLTDYVLDPATHTGQPGYDMTATPKERLTVDKKLEEGTD
jgi:FkbM family methyltransferase